MLKGELACLHIRAGQSILWPEICYGKQVNFGALQDCGEKGATISGGQRQR